ncbi:MAG: cyclic nucleotide-binding domain-containing protein [Hydrogenophilales bacterium]|nr:cyclic nucleotide-binding domain-containing protein [Hydrogenophilales bacterium]
MITPEKLAAFIPFDTLTAAGLGEATKAATERFCQPGEVLFRQGEDDGVVYYLLEGEVILTTAKQDTALVVRAGSETARHPLARLKPRRYKGVATGPVKVVVIDDDFLENLITADQTAAYEVAEIDGEDPEWMFRLLTPPAFQRVPSANLAALFAKLEPVPVKAGQVILREGEPGDYYYLIKAGRAQVTRRHGEKENILAELEVGGGFGEEALLSGDPRNASVSMLTDGILMRLSKADFDPILREPLVHWVDIKQAGALIKGGAGLLDVRLEDEFRAHTLAGAHNLPLYLLRHKARALDMRRKYILFCQTDRRSCAAAFLLTQRGFDVYVLKGGINSVQEGR